MLSYRFHYGHPDVWNKLFCLGKGSISKATRNLHVSEDIFGGMNCVLRGGLVDYKDYIMVGKGRDMGFISINGFEIKVSQILCHFAKIVFNMQIKDSVLNSVEINLYLIYSTLYPVCDCNFNAFNYDILTHVYSRI